MPETHVRQRSAIAAELDFFEQCEAAISAHGEWKFKLTKAIENRGEGLDSQKVSLDNQCVFGRWLYSDQTAEYRSDVKYERVRSLHANFHKYAGSIVHQCQHDQLSDARTALSENSPYARTSQQLIQEIAQWIRMRQQEAGAIIEDSQSSEGLKKRISRYGWLGGLLGFSFGLLFIVAAIIISCINYSLPISVGSVLHAHSLSPVNYLVDLAPFVLGGGGIILGLYFEKNKQSELNLENLVQARTRQLASFQHESDRILDSLTDGVFLMGPDRRAGSRFSRSLNEIFETTDITGRSVASIFKGRISDQTTKEIEGYLDLVFDTQYSEKMIVDLNPFNPLKLDAYEEGGEKHLSVQFSRILNASGSIESILVVASDITEEVMLRQQIELKEKENQNQLHLIREIFNIGPETLLSFKHQMRQEIDEISSLLRDPVSADPKVTLEHIFRRVHNVKGSAALLNLSSIADAAHTYEEKLTELRHRQNLTEGDFLPLTVLHANMLRKLNDLRQTVEQIQAFQGKHASQSGDEALAELLKRLVARAGAEQKKEIQINLINFSTHNIAAEKSNALRDIFVQLIRNSAAHGIETPADRTAKAKPERGTITIGLEQEPHLLRYTYRDDGRGFDIDAIRQRVVEKGLLRDDAASRLSKQAILKYIFTPGFSTKNEADMTSGRGVGMNLVAEKIRELEGKLTLRWKDGEFAEFQVIIPVKE